MLDAPQRISTLESNVKFLKLAMILLAVVQLLTLARVATSQERVNTPTHAVKYALQDVALLHNAGVDLGVIRYVWFPPHLGSEAIPAFIYGWNAALNSTEFVRVPERVGDGSVLRLDFSQVAADEITLIQQLNVWNQLSNADPYFHIPTVRVTSGKTSSKRNSLARHCYFSVTDNDKTFQTFGALIFRADWFAHKMLSTTRGGRYYGFSMPVVRLPGVKATPQELFLAKYGVSSDIDNALGDQRAGILQSKVTGKPRQALALRAAGSRVGAGLGWVTLDITDEDIDANQDPIENLEEFNAKALEIILEKPCGLHAFALFDQDGGLVKSVPDNVARDHTIEKPHTGRLEPGVSCIACHASEGGIQPLPNDIKAMLDGGIGDIFDQFSPRALKGDRITRLERLAARYGGDLTDKLLGARHTYAIAVAKCTVSPEFPSGMTVEQAGNGLGSLCRDYLYQLVTPDQAALELGYRCEEGQGPAILQTLIPAVQGFREIPAVLMLKSGMSITRVQWERVFADARIRVLQTEAFNLNL